MALPIRGSVRGVSHVSSVSHSKRLTWSPAQATCGFRSQGPLVSQVPWEFPVSSTSYSKLFHSFLLLLVTPQLPSDGENFCAGLCNAGSDVIVTPRKGISRQ